MMAYKGGIKERSERELEIWRKIYEEELWRRKKYVKGRYNGKGVRKG